MTLFTYGYEGTPLATFISRLKIAGVQSVFDVRQLPLSRKPGFSKQRFADALHAAGIFYAHLPAFGCPKTIRDRYKADGDWSAYSVGFAAHLADQTAAISELATIAQKTTACLVCFEADFNRCHRSFVARVVARAGGIAVVHLFTKGEIVEFGGRVAA